MLNLRNYIKSINFKCYVGKLTIPWFRKKSLLKILFVNLSACKGACCVEGEAGAPIDKEETKLLEKHYDAITPFMNKKGKASH